MSIGIDGVRIRRPAPPAKRPKKTGRSLLAVLFIVEAVLSLIFYISLAAHFIWPEQAGAVPGIPQYLSYEGRLTDASGNPLGGSGTDYCFKFSIYEDATVGAPDTKVWPTGSPTGQSITVTDGIFDALIGSADALDFNFYTNDTVYLNVEAATKVGASCTNGDETYENLSPRQQITASGFAIAAENVYGSLLKTDVANSKVQIGTGTGTSSQMFLALDVRNTSDTIGGACTTSGTLWYNSSNSRALVCDNGTIQKIGNLDTIVGIKESSNGTAISTGTVNFVGSNGISVHQNGQTLSISNQQAFGVSNLNGSTAGNTGSQTGTFVFAGTGGNVTLSQITGAGGVHTIAISAANGGVGGGASLNGYNIPYGVGPGAIGNMSTFENARLSVIPFKVPANLTVDNLRIVLSMLSTASSSYNLSVSMAVYTRNASTLSLASSASRVLSVSANANNSLSYTGLRGFDIASNLGTISNNSWVFTPGDYWFGLWMRSTNYGTWSILGTAFGSTNFIGAFGNASATSRNIAVFGPAVFSATFSTAMPASIASNALQNNVANSNRIPYIYLGDEPATL